MKRFHEETHLMTARQRFDRKTTSRVKHQGRYRKMRPLDCGKTHCGVCHRHKMFGHEETRQEQRNELAFREQVAD